MSQSIVTALMRTLERSVLAIIVLSAAIAASASADEIYKSTDAQGRPVYSDRPLSPSAERVVIRPSSNPAAAQTSAAQVQATNQRLEEQRKQEQARQAEKRAAQEAKDQRAERCRRARDRYLMFAEANRLYRRDAQGNRVYYTGAEIDAERSAAEEAMKELCDEKTR